MPPETVGQKHADCIECLPRGCQLSNSGQEPVRQGAQVTTVDPVLVAELRLKTRGTAGVTGVGVYAPAPADNSKSNWRVRATVQFSLTATSSARIIEARRCTVTGLSEARISRTDEVAEHHAGELEPEHEMFLAEERLHPSLDEIFRQIDAAHRRTLEFERMHPARARHGSR